MAITYTPELLKKIQDDWETLKYQYETKIFNTTATAGPVTNGYWIQKPARKENIRYLNKPEVRNNEA
jgi:hypothetical protein